MRLYRYDPDANRYNGYSVSSKDKDQVLSIHFDDGPLPSKPVKVEGFDDNPGDDGDFPSLSNFRIIPIASQRAWDVLRPLIGDHAEALPVQHPSGKPYYLIHVKEVVDCVDLDRSEVDRYSDGRVMKVVTFCIRPEIAQGKHMFKTTKECGGDLIVDEAFRETVETNDLKGLLFSPLPTICP